MSTVQEQIRRYINDSFLFEADPERVPVSEPLFGSGLLDSANMVDIIMFLEATFAISIPSVDIVPENFETIDRMAGYVERAMQIQR